MITTSTTTLAPAPTSFKPSSYNNQFNSHQQEPYPFQSTEDPHKYSITSTTTINYDEQNNRRETFESTTERFKPIDFEKKFTTSTQRPTINSFYYGFNFTKSSTQYPFLKSFTFTTTKSPYNFEHFQNSYFNDIKTTSTVPPTQKSIITTTTQQPPSAPRSSIPFAYTAETPSPVFYSQPEMITPSTRNPVFDLYLKRLSSTTKNPYDFGNLGQYFKTTTINPRFPNNLFGANSNRLNSTLSSPLHQR